MHRALISGQVEPAFPLRKTLGQDDFRVAPVGSGERAAKPLTNLNFPVTILRNAPLQIGLN